MDFEINVMSYTSFLALVINIVLLSLFTIIRYVVDKYYKSAMPLEILTVFLHIAFV